MKRVLAGVFVLGFLLAGFGYAQDAKPVFNGKDLDGWKPQAKASWVVDNGEIVGKQEGTPTSDAWLFTEAEYGDFVLELEFKVPAQCNTGIALRMPKEKVGDPDMNGYELQICDIKGKHPTGSLIHHVDSKTNNAFKPDEWNTLKVTCEGEHIVIVLNGEVTLDTKQKGPKKGRIGMQVAKGKEFAAMEYRFRNIKVTEPGVAASGPSSVPAATEAGK